ncbi:hypothetical protein MKW98_018139, partial [Papaver atlanticum]
MKAESSVLTQVPCKEFCLPVFIGDPSSASCLYDSYHGLRLVCLSLANWDDFNLLLILSYLQVSLHGNTTCLHNSYVSLCNGCKYSFLSAS